MYLAYSALRNPHQSTVKKQRATARLTGYHAACQKHRQTIAEIQQYLPGWQPPLPAFNG